MKPGKVRGRFAPSPTGKLHLGNAAAALVAWLHARSQAGEFLLRIEDLDRVRCRPHFVDNIFRDLEYLGLTWDGEVLFQSTRATLYESALERLDANGRLYPCFCSRAEIARAASAPHALSDEGPPYPGICRDLTPDEVQRRVSSRHSFALRFRAAGPTSLIDLIHGPYTHNVVECVGDFVVRSRDGTASYQLAVVVDDALSAVTHIVRGGDLMSSTPRQIQLFQALGYAIPTFAHVPLILGSDGKRLAKRDGAFTVETLRSANVDARRLIGLLAGWVGLSDGAPVPLDELIGQFDLSRLRRPPVRVDEESITAALGL